MKLNYERTNPIIKSDLNKFTLVAEVDSGGVSTTKIELELFQLDVLKLIQFSERCSNEYYARKFRKFLNKVNRMDKYNKDKIINYNRKLPRIYLKDLESWEIQELKEEFE